MNLSNPKLLGIIGLLTGFLNVYFFQDTQHYGIIRALFIGMAVGFVFVFFLKRFSSS